MNKVIALSLGVFGHVLFVVAIGLMGYSLFWGLTRPIFSAGHLGWWINWALIFSFPVGHSILLSGLGRRLLTRMLPKEIGSKMVTTSFALIASLQVGVFFAFWTPVGGIWFEPRGVLHGVFTAAYALSWIGLAVSIYEAGIGLQTGAIGWLSVLGDRKPRYPDMPRSGLHGICRHPIYQSFLMILLTGPVWGPDHLIIAVIWGLYCIIGPLFKEKRLRAAYGERYQSYALQVPYYFVPGADRS